MDPLLLSSKIIDRIEKDRSVTYSQLEARAVEKGISLDIFESAMARVHKNKSVEMKTTGEEITYTVKKPELPAIHSHVTWCREHYPYPGRDGVPEFVMPFPEIDMSFIFLKPEELDKFKAELRGRVFIPKKRWQHAKSH